VLIGFIGTVCWERGIGIMKGLGIILVMESITLVMFIPVVRSICQILLGGRKPRSLFILAHSIEIQPDYSLNIISSFHNNIHNNMII
jgi:hypothetical protein